MDYLDFSGHAGGFQEAAEDSERGAQHYNQRTSPKPAFYTNVTHPMSCDIKPRLTKEQHDILEAQYNKVQKPNTNVKKGFAESLNVSLDKVNVSI